MTQTVSGMLEDAPVGPDADSGGLRRKCLGFTEVLGQSVANAATAR